MARNLKPDEGSYSTKTDCFTRKNKGYYYKAIPLGMPTCHGDKQTDIEADVLQAINLKYPNDKATGYKIGDLRGLWKMEFERK